METHTSEAQQQEEAARLSVTQNFSHYLVFSTHHLSRSKLPFMRVSSQILLCV